MSIIEQYGLPRLASAEAAFRAKPPDLETDRREPAAVGIDLGSGHVRIWASGRPFVQLPSINDSLSDPRPLIRRGLIADPSGLRTLLARMAGRYEQPLPTGAVVVACRPVLSTPPDEHTTRELLTTIFNPSRLLLTPTLRAAAIGAGVAPGPLLIADLGADLTEVALLANGSLIAARQADIGTRDLIGPTAIDVVVDTVGALVEELRRDPPSQDVYAAAAHRGLILVGGGATAPQLAARTTGALRLPARSARRPRVAAVHGAGLCALATIRRTARGDR